MIQPIIRTTLLNDPDISQTVGNRIYDLVFPRINSQLPALILQRISETTDSVNMSHATVLQIDSYADTHSQADTLDRQVKATLTNHSETGSRYDVINIIPINSTDFYDAVNRTYRISTDYSVIWRMKDEEMQ